MDITESVSSTGTSAGRTSSRRMRGVDPTASLGASEGGKDSASGQQQKQIVFRRRARRQTLSGVEAGYSTFTAGISLGWYAELGSLKFRQAVAAEFLATLIFVFAVVSMVVFTSDSKFNEVSATLASTTTPVTFTTITAKFDFPMPRILLLSLSIGFLIAALVFSVGSISGANINPAVTLALAVTQKMSVFRAACYAVAQCIGAMVGAVLVRSIAPALFDGAGGGANAVRSNNPGIGVWTVLGGEALGTGLLVLTVCAAADAGREKNNKYQGALTPLCIGLAVTCAHFLLGGIDGCSINPARSLGPAIAKNDFTDLWMFFVGPTIGSLAAAFVYTVLFTGLGVGVDKWEEKEGEEGGGGEDGREEGGRSRRPSFWDDINLPPRSAQSFASPTLDASLDYGGDESGDTTTISTVENTPQFDPLPSPALMGGNGGGGGSGVLGGARPRALSLTRAGVWKDSVGGGGAVKEW